MAINESDVRSRFNLAFVHTLGGFCLCVKREVLDKIGPALNDWSDLNLFDSDILSAKAKQAGYSLAACRDLFVHHFGTRTFAHGVLQNDPKTKDTRTS